MLRIAAETFAITPRAGCEGRTLTGEKAGLIFSPLKSTVYLVDDGRTRLCLLTSHFMTHYYRISNVLRHRLAEALGLDRDQVFVFSSHNHCSVKLNRRQYSFGFEEEGRLIPESELTREGHALANGVVKAARGLTRKLTPASVWWGVGHERRITHNRKGRRADGSTYLMREEDRLLLGRDFNGDIDDDAPVVGFRDARGRWVAFLTQFTGHPVSAYHCEHPVVFGEYPQIACDDLSEAFGGVPAGFLQGCAGDINSKGLLSPRPVEQNVADATRYGHYLGKTYARTARRLQPSAQDDLGYAWEWVSIPYQGVPPGRELTRQIAEMDDFLARCARNDENTRTCNGLNFPLTMTPRYRAALIQPLQRWAEWALAFHKEGRLDQAPTERRFRMAVIRIGDVGIVGLPCEPFSGIGRQIKAHSPLPLAIPCGYMNDTSPAYVPDAANNGDREYMSAFYRYTTTMLPYKQPAGDLLARAGVRLLREVGGGAESGVRGADQNT